MKPHLRWSSVLLAAVFALLAVLLFLMRDVLLKAHVDESILRFASDASVYYAAYENIFADVELLESPGLFLVGSPILFMRLAEGDLLLIQACNLLLMYLALKAALDALGTFQGRMTFLALALVFPYFAFGFLGLNKEVYAMSAAIFFGSWLIGGRRLNLLLALVLASCARYYMVIALIALVFTVPRSRPPRLALVAAMLLVISAAAPFAKMLIPSYSYESVLDNAGRIGLMFASLIDNFGYAIAYPFKYVMLVPTRFYGFLIGASEDAMGAAASLLSILMVIAACVVWYRDKDPMVRRLIVAGFVAPVPIMWSEIMHWRYYSFVYFFFLYAFALHGELLRRRRRALHAGLVEPA